MMFSLADVWGWRPDGSNPCRHVKRFNEHRRERFLSPDETARLGSSEHGLSAVRVSTLAGMESGDLGSNGT